VINAQCSSDRGDLVESPVANGGEVGDVKQSGIRTHSRSKTTAGKKDAVPNARSNARRNTRQMPVEMPGVDTLLNDGQFDRATGWENLWRIEKDGNSYRWRLRFTADRRSRPGGKITPAIRRKLKRRPGKGRHLASRTAADRLKRRAEFIAERLRAGDQRRAEGQGDAFNVGGRSGSPCARVHDPVLECGQMLDVRELDNWPDVPDMLM
jgi:hypothetical protein